MTNTEVQEKVSRAERIHPFSIVTRAYEERLDEKYGITLAKLKNGKRLNRSNGGLERNVFFGEGPEFLQPLIDYILKKYSSLPGFCSMKIKDSEELELHMKKIHELSYTHYVFGKEINIKGKFPSKCCGISSINLFMGLMNLGYPNVSRINNCSKNHAYISLPFMLGSSKQKGFIIVDPTSDQLFESKDAPRNSTFVTSGKVWKYETDWAKGMDLYPLKSRYSDFSNLFTLRDPNLNASEDMTRYFREVFKNPVKIDVDLS